MVNNKSNTNPAGKHGKPFSLAPHSFDEALKKILKATPVPQPERKKTQPRNPGKAAKKR